MDPKQTLADIIGHLSRDEWQNARDAMKDYRAWREAGGFPALVATQPHTGKLVVTITN